MTCFSAEEFGQFTRDPWGTLGQACQLPFHDIEVPFVVALVCVLIVTLFAVAFLWLLISTTTFTWTFSRLARRLRSIRKPDEAMDSPRLEQVSQILGTSRSTRHGWREFAETLITDDRGILNTRPAQDFFPEHEIVEARIHLGFFDAVPALLTGLGLFATFVALYIGLGSLTVPEGSGQIEGIPKFIQALSGKFLSSVLGLFTAVVFTFFKALRIPRAHRVYRRFCEAFDALFQRVTSEDLLRRLNSHSAEQSATLKHLATDISDRFQDGMNENLKPPLERMIDLLQRSLEERSQTFEDMASRLAETFRSNFNQSTNFEFDRVTSALEQTLAMVSRMEDRSAENQRAFQELVTRLDQSTSQLSAKLESAASNLGVTQSQARQALDETVRQVLAANARQAEQGAEQTRSVIESLRTGMSQVMENLERAAGGLQQGGLDAQSKLVAAAEMLTERVSSGASETTQALAGTAQAMIENSTQQSTQIQQRLEMLLDREQGRTELLDQQQAAHREAVRDFGRVMVESKASLESLQFASAGTREAASVLQQAANQIRDIQVNAASTIEAGAEQAREMRATLDANRNLLTEYDRVFRTVDEGLSTAVKRLAEEMVRFQEDATEQLRRQLGVFDDHLGAATDKLGRAVQDLGDRLEDASETIANSVDRARPKPE